MTTTAEMIGVVGGGQPASDVDQADAPAGDDLADANVVAEDVVVDTPTPTGDNRADVAVGQKLSVCWETMPDGGLRVLLHGVERYRPTPSLSGSLWWASGVLARHNHDTKCRGRRDLSVVKNSGPYDAWQMKQRRKINIDLKFWEFLFFGAFSSAKHRTVL